jgi:hypothetical protein
MRIRRIATGILAALCALVAAGRADAIAVNFDGPGGYGISASRAAAAEADGLQIIDVTELANAASFGLTIPAPSVLDFDLVGSPSFGNPNRATSEWNVTNSGQMNLADAWLVFLYPTTYTPSQVGFEIDDEDGWAVINVFIGGTDYYYPARFLGDLEPTDAVAFTMRHLVGQPLSQSGGTYVLPQYSVGAVQGIPVPEPAALALVASGLLLVSALRRSRV